MTHWLSIAGLVDQDWSNLEDWTSLAGKRWGVFG
jgi:hypothetical protein